MLKVVNFRNYEVDKVLRGCRNLLRQLFYACPLLNLAIKRPAVDFTK